MHSGGVPSPASASRGAWCSGRRGYPSRRIPGRWHSSATSYPAVAPKSRSLPPQRCNRHCSTIPRVRHRTPGRNTGRKRPPVRLPRHLYTARCAARLHRRGTVRTLPDRCRHRRRISPPAWTPAVRRTATPVAVLQRRSVRYCPALRHSCP